MPVACLRKSSKADKKYMVTVDGKTVHFGQRGASDYTKHKDSKRMKRYATRHSRRENWGSSGIKTAGFWSKNLLWSKPSMSAAKRYVSSRYGIRFSCNGSGARKTAKKSVRRSGKRKTVKRSRSRR